MLRHIFTFLGLRGVRAEVRFAEGPIEFSNDELHRKGAAVEARAAVAALAEGASASTTKRVMSAPGAAPSEPAT
jgi:1-acyl-sn-glycerol-3-phosphate acyltransferase